MVYERSAVQGGFDHGSVAPGNFNDWREQSQSFERLIAIDQRAFGFPPAAASSHTLCDLKRRLAVNGSIRWQ